MNKEICPKCGFVLKIKETTDSIFGYCMNNNCEVINVLFREKYNDYLLLTDNSKSNILNTKEK